MAERSGAFEVITTFGETFWREFFAALFTDGPLKGARVNGSAGGDLAVTAAGANMNVDIATGVAIVNGGFYENTASLPKTLAASNPSNPRIDRIVVRYDFSGRVVSVQVLTGTPAGSPVAPALTQTATTFEVSLARVLVGANVTTINNGNITDERVFAQGNIQGTALSALLVKATGGTVSGNTDFTGTLTKSSNTVWHAGNDGAGSGLDADTVDGAQLSALAQLGSAANFTAGLQKSGKDVVYAQAGLTGKFSAQSSAPSSPADGDLWLDTSVVLS